MKFGPDELGRGIVIPLNGQPPPDFPPAADTYQIDEPALVQPDRLLTNLHRHWLRRERVVIRLGVDKEHLKTAERLEIEPYQLDPRFEFSQERLHFLIWANNYDATGEEPVWWYQRLALRLGALAHDSAEVEIDGGARWCDGGPRTSVPFVPHATNTTRLLFEVGPASSDPIGAEHQSDVLLRLQRLFWKGLLAHSNAERPIDGDFPYVVLGLHPTLQLM